MTPQKKRDMAHKTKQDSETSLKLVSNTTVAYLFPLTSHFRPTF